ncbi:MAG: ABC transporter permease [Verrucomicrobiota bacterium]
MLSDLRFALRLIATHRWFSVVVVLTLALGIGINTTVFTLVNAVLFKPVPVPRGERLVTVAGQDLTRPDSRRSLSYPDYLEFKTNTRSFDGLEAAQGQGAVISESGNPPDRYVGQRVTPGLFALLQIPPVAGRGFSAEDGKPGAPEVLLIGYTVWKNRYGLDPNIAGRAVRYNGASATIIGVMPEGCRFPNRDDVWSVLKPTEDLEKRTSRQLQVFGILKSDTDIPAASADLNVIAQRLAKEFPDTNKDTGALLRTFHDTYNGAGIRRVFITMLGAVGLVLLIACANVANLMLSRAIGRQREIAVRASLGATRWQIIRQLLVESVLLSLLGGALGLAIAAGGVHLFDLATQDVGKPYWIQFSMDFRVFGYIAAVSIVCGLVFGLAPALRASRVDLAHALKDGTLGSGSASGGKLTAVLVVFQFALTVILLTAAGLVIRSFIASHNVNDFVPRERIFTARMSLPGGKGERYAERGERIRFYETLVERLAGAPGVTHVAMTSHLPGLGNAGGDVEIEGQPLAKDDKPHRTALNVLTPTYLSSIGLPIVQGRGFNAIDGEAGKEVAIVTAAFAAKHWPQQPAVGQRFRFLEGQERKPKEWLTVIGVCANIVQSPQDVDAPPLVYLPHRQEGWGGMTMLVRTGADPAGLAPQIRAIVQQLDQDLPLFEVRTLTGALERNRWFLVVFGTLFLTFAALALLMATIGLYAVVAHATTRRTREIGIRMALGATAQNIIRLVLSRGLIQLGIGLVLGLAGAYASMFLLGRMNMLVGTSPKDPLVFSAVAALLVLVGIAACWVPARRAARIAPTVALRVE